MYKSTQEDPNKNFNYRKWTAAQSWTRTQTQTWQQ